MTDEVGFRVDWMWSRSGDVVKAHMDGQDGNLTVEKWQQIDGPDMFYLTVRGQHRTTLAIDKATAEALHYALGHLIAGRVSVKRNVFQAPLNDEPLS